MHQAIISAATEGGTNPLVPNPWEMLVVFAGFALLLFIVVKYVVPMFEKTFAERAEAIDVVAVLVEHFEHSKSTRRSSPKPAPKPTASARKHAPKVPRSLQS